MNKIKKGVGRFVYITGVLLPLFCLTNIPQAQPNENIHSGLMKHLLRSSGIKAEIIQLQRPDGFSEAIFIEGPQGKMPIIIGFKQNKIEKGEPFLVSINGCEKLMRISEDGSYVVLDEDSGEDEDNETDDGEDNETDDGGDEDDNGISTAICIFDVVVDTIKAIEMCEEDDSFCIVIAIFSMVLDIIQCAD